MLLNKNVKIFITGCGGMLGEAVYHILKNKCNIIATDIDINSTFLHYADVRNINQIREQIMTVKPHIIFHLAALTDLEYCELHQKEAWETNAFATERIALLCKELNIPMVYISTAGIFDGKQEFYTDYDVPNPLNIYGKSKYAGELAVQRLVDKHFIFRAGWMMGGGPDKDKKFVSKIMKQVIMGKKELFVVDDKIGTPTYTYDFVKNMLLVIEKDAYGLYNQVCEGYCSRYELAEEILKLLKNKSIKLTKVNSNYFKEKYFAVRPRSESLIPLKLKQKDLYIMRDWKVCLKEYMNRWKESMFLYNSLAYQMI